MEKTRRVMTPDGVPMEMIVTEQDEWPGFRFDTDADRWVRTNPAITESLQQIKDATTLGAEALQLLRDLNQAYYSDARHWGMAGVSQDDGLRFLRAYETLIVGASPELQKGVMVGGRPHACDVAGCEAHR